MTLASDEATDVRTVSFTELPSFSDLFTTYCTDFDTLAPYYARDFRSAADRADIAEVASAHPRNRETLVEVLLEQNEAWGLDAKTRAHIEALRDPASVAVVTGQQLGLLTGPLYTLYKTITAIQLTQQFTAETGHPAVPVFWLAGEDHDFAEVQSTHMLRGNNVQTLTYTGHTLPEDEGDNLGPVGRLVFAEQLEDVLTDLQAVLPPTDFNPNLVAAVREAYQPGTTFRDAFVRLMRTLFPNSGIVFISADDVRLKRLTAPLFRHEIEDYTTPHAAIEAASAALEESYHAQVRTHPTNLFWMDETGRYPIDAEGDAFHLRRQDRTFTRDELLAQLEAHPERFSPNVVLRPLMQDALLPSVAYVAGPGEVAYFAQYKAVYAWAGIPMPIIYPRASVTLIESKVQKVLDRFDLTLGALDTELDKLFRRYVLDHMDVDVDTLFKEASTPVHQAVNGLKPQVEVIDASLGKATEAMRAALVKELERFKGRVVKAAKRNVDQVRDQFAKAQGNLYPDGKLQERRISALYFLNKYGLSFFEDLIDTLSLDTTVHQTVHL